MAVTYIAIDPGEKGGIAIRYGDAGNTNTYNMPDGYPNIYDLLKELKDTHPGDIRAIMEDVGHGIPGQSSTATASFGRHNGHIEMALYALGIPTVKVTPQKWQKYFSNTIGTSKGLTKTVWKNKLKAVAKTLYPSQNVTLYTADALLMLEYAYHTKL